jgi:hypothetical protein
VRRRQHKDGRRIAHLHNEATDGTRRVAPFGEAVKVEGVIAENGHRRAGRAKVIKTHRTTQLAHQRCVQWEVKLAWHGSRALGDGRGQSQRSAAF